MIKGVRSLSFLCLVWGFLAGPLLLMFISQISALRFGFSFVCFGAVLLVLTLDPSTIRQSNGDTIGPVGRFIFYGIFILLFGTMGIIMVFFPELLKAVPRKHA
jgi:hypothetical protein